MRIILQIAFAKWKQSHRALDTYINNNYTNVTKLMKITLNSTEDS